MASGEGVPDGPVLGQAQDCVDGADRWEMFDKTVAKPRCSPGREDGDWERAGVGALPEDGSVLRPVPGCRVVDEEHTTDPAVCVVVGARPVTVGLSAEGRRTIVGVLERRSVERGLSVRISGEQGRVANRHDERQR